MELLFATTNPAKVKSYAEKLKQYDIKLKSIKDLNFKLDIDENGKNSIENAEIKAKAYYDATKITTLGMDVSLIIEELPEEEQIGTHIRRINGKYLTDEEAITYYTKPAKQYGGKLSAKWVYGVVIYNGKEVKKYSYSKENFYFIDKASKKRNPGYPLDSISIIPKFNKYLIELTEEEKRLNQKEQNTEVFDFIVNSLKVLNK